jgi:hypothetical protein
MTASACSAILAFRLISRYFEIHSILLPVCTIVIFDKALWKVMVLLLDAI